MNQTKNNEITIIGLSIAIIIGGGMAIYMIAAVVPLPGIKIYLRSTFCVYYILCSSTQAQRKIYSS